MNAPKPKFAVGSPVFVHNKEGFDEPAKVARVRASGATGEWVASGAKLDLSGRKKRFIYEVKLQRTGEPLIVPEDHLRDVSGARAS